MQNELEDSNRYPPAWGIRLAFLLLASACLFMGIWELPFLGVVWQRVLGVSGLILMPIALIQLYLPHRRTLAELFQRNASLEREVAELHHTNDSLVGLDQSYRSLIDLSPDAIFVLDDGCIVYTNMASARLLVCPRTESLRRRNIADFISPSFRERVSNQLRLLGQPGARLPLSRGQMVRMDGSFAEVELTASSFLYKGRLAVQVVVRDISERLEAENAQKESEERYRQMFQRNRAVKLLLDPESGDIVDANVAACEYYGSAYKELRGRNISELVAERSDRALSEIEESFRSRRRLAEQVHKAAGGRERNVEIHASAIHSGGKSVVYCIIYDVTVRKQAEAELRFRMDFENLITAISTHFINLARDQVDAGIGQALRSIGEFAGVDRSYLFHLNPRKSTFTNTYEWCRIGVEAQIENLRDIPCASFPWFMDRLRQGEPVHVPDVDNVPSEAIGEKTEWLRESIQSLVVLPMMDRGELIGFLGFDSVIEKRTWSEESISLLKIVGEIFVNTLQRHEMEKKLLYDATHDPLTGLSNPKMFTHRVYRVIEKKHADPSFSYAVLFLDVDRFKVVNDSLGHLFGDKLLVRFARRLSKYLRLGENLARLGGDEFAILLEGIQGEEDAISQARRIQSALKKPFLVGGHEIFTTCSIGIAIGESEHRQPQELIRDADTAMYRAKASGRDGYQVFNKSMHEKALHLLRLENDLRKASIGDEFEMYYQPIIHLETGDLKGFEALIRWNHPKLGLVSPAEFIPLAEETGTIIPIGHWVLDESCRQLAVWQREFGESLHGLTMSVNISAKQFSAGHLAEDIGQAAVQAGIQPENLVLEITESVLMKDTTMASLVLDKLRDDGFQLSLDDFGTGYSSLSYLHRFPFHLLKIDRSFVMRLEPGKRDAEIIRTINALAGHLGMDVVAEGIETEDQLDTLRGLGCVFGQGYLFAKPMPGRLAGEFIEAIQRKKGKAIRPASENSVRESQARTA